MWVSKREYDRLEGQVKDFRAENINLAGDVRVLHVKLEAAATQKAKDDITIDWMRHRVNALEKQNSLLLGKAAGIQVPVPEIVPTRPGSMTVPDFSSMPSFEDIGDEAAKQEGIQHDEVGQLVFTK